MNQKGKLAGTLTQPVKQPYCICCLTAYSLKEVLWGDVKNVNMLSKNISSPLVHKLLIVFFM